MKEALWGYWLIVLGVFIIVVLLLVQSFTSTNTQDYYLVKTITEASMEDSIDWSYYRLYGEVKINKEKFYEVFLRRFAEEASIATTYTIEFNEVYEAPPKVGVKVSSKSSTFNISGDSTTFDIVNKIDAILENRSTVAGPNSEAEKKPYGGENPESEGDDENPGGGESPSGESNLSSPLSSTNEIKSVTGETNDQKNLANNGIDLSKKSDAEMVAIAKGVGSSFNKDTTSEVDKVGLAINNVYDKLSDSDKKDFVSLLNSAEYHGASEGELKTYQERVASYAKKANAAAPVAPTPTPTSGDGSERIVVNDNNLTSEEKACRSGVTLYDLKGMRGVSMANNTKVQKSVDDTTSIASLSAGTDYVILGSNQNASMWAIQYGDVKCGWVSSLNQGINLKQYLKGLNVEFNITNLSGSIYKSLGQPIPGLTGQQLYSDKFRTFVPGTYQMAQKLYSAASKITNDGLTLVVYDAYRPYAVTRKAYDVYSAYLSANSSIKKQVLTAANGSYWAENWFLAASRSAHNTGCALDLSLKEYEGSMPGPIHELSARGVKYTSSSSGVMLDSVRYNEGAYKLNVYMTSAGFGDLASEWWHYQDNACYNRAKYSIDKATFWSNV